MSKWEKFLDSYYHYREILGFGFWYALYRATYYEIRGREPWAK